MESSHKWIRTSIATAALVLLTACGAPAASSPEAALTRIVDINDYQMQIFSSWEEISGTSLDTQLSPANIRVFQSMQPIRGIYSKLSIIKEELLTPVSSLAYADANIVNTPKITQNYTKLQSLETSIAGERTLIHVYQGQSTALSPLLLFIQTFVVHEGTKGYTITFSISPSVKDTAAYMDLLETLRFDAAKAL